MLFISDLSLRIVLDLLFIFDPSRRIVHFPPVSTYCSFPTRPVSTFCSFLTRLYTCCSFPTRLYVLLISDPSLPPKIMDLCIQVHGQSRGKRGGLMEAIELPRFSQGSLDCDNGDDDELMLNVLRCHLTY